MLLVGGTTGTGKSTMATEIAHRLGIVRTQSTDMLREVMRMLVPERLLPVLHTSSFNAWQALQSQPGSGDANAVVDGYRSQSELLLLPIEAVLQRALRERVSLILEGIHVHPMLLDRIQDRGDAIIVPIMLAVLKQKQLKKRLIGRGIQAPQREAERQLSHFDAIWSLQEYLLAEADRANVSIIANEDREHAIRVVLHTIIDALSKNFSSTPREAFL
jgi:2-phosphoglycerate kinase